MPFFNTRGRDNYFMEFGEGRPLLLLHGITNSGRAWGPQIAPLVEAGYRVIVPDHAGHGASAPVSAPFGVGDIADDVEGLLSHLGIDMLDVVGLSLGGMVALELALRHPARVRRQVVANSFDRTATPAFGEMAEGWAKTFQTPHGAVTRLEESWPSLVSPEFRKSADGLRTYQVWHGIAATSDGASLAHVSRGITTFDVSERLAELAPPTLFIAGSLDRMSPPELGRQMAERTRDGHYELIEGAAHISNVDASDAFTARVLDFLA